eukprot:COSAG02_NODE_533_length_20665_cov_216.617281_13_plen_242_part_00
MALPSSGNADGLAAKLAWQTLSGVAMGWANDGVPDDASTLYNGSGTVDWLVRPEGGREREWLQRLAALRRGAGSYLVHGHRARDLIPHNGSAANRTFGPIRVPSLQAQAWIARQGVAQGSSTHRSFNASMDANCSMAVLVAAVRADPDGTEELHFVIRAADLAAVFGDSYTTRGVVMERVHGSWERDGRFHTSDIISSSDVESAGSRRSTIVRRLGGSEQVQYRERLGPRDLRFFRVCNTR